MAKSSIEKILQGPSAKKQAKVAAWAAATEQVYVSNADKVQARINELYAQFHVVAEGSKALTASQTAHNERLQKSVDFWMTLQGKSAGIKR